MYKLSNWILLEFNLFKKFLNKTKQFLITNGIKWNQEFSYVRRVIYRKNCSNQTYDYWLIAPNQQTLLTETIF